MRSLAMITCSILLLQPALAQANDEMTNAQEEIRSHRTLKQSGMDTDQDGTITQREFVTYHSQTFKKADLNRDGVITRDEFEKRNTALNQELQELANAHLQELMDQIEEERALAEAAKEAAEIQPAAGAETEAKTIVPVPAVPVPEAEDAKPSPGLQSPQDPDPRRHEQKSAPPAP